MGVTNIDEPPEGRVDIPVGATLVIYTDGLVERRDVPLRAGIEALTATLARLPDGMTAADTRNVLVGQLVGPEQEDDVCVLVLRRLHG